MQNLDYDFLFQAAPIALIVTDKKGTILQINKHAALLLEQKEKQLTGTNIIQLLDQSPASFTFSDFCVRLGDQHEHIIKTKNGLSDAHINCHHDQAKYEGQYIFSFHVSRTATARKEALEKLRVIEERYKSIIAVSNTGAWEYHLDTHRIWFSKEYCTQLGIDRQDGTWDESIEKLWVERLHPDDRDRSIKIFQDYLEQGSPGFYENIFRIQHENGHWVSIWSRGRRLRDADGNLTNVTLGTHIDITERVKAEEKVKETEKRIKRITSLIPCNTYMFDIEDNGRVNMHFLNRGTEEYNHSHDLEKVKAKPETLTEVLHPDDIVKFNGAMMEGHRTQAPISFQFRMMVNDKIRWRWAQAVSEKDESGKVMWYGATSDITSLVDYITSIEQMLFDIAHVIRRPVATLKGLTNIIKKKDFTEAELQDITVMLDGVAEEMDKFTKELNQEYHKSQEKNALSNFDFSQLIDKRKSLFN